MRKINRQKRPVHVINQPLFSRNFLLFAIFLTILALAYLIQRNSIKTMLLEISTLEKKLDEMIIDNRNLQTEMYRLSANDVIRRKAIKDLNMVEPKKKPEVVFYHDKNQLNAGRDMLSELYMNSGLVFQNPNSLIHSVGE